MRLIDANALIEKAKEEGAYDYVSAKEIAEAPTVDAVEVVRCRNCKFSRDTGDYQDTYHCTSRTHAQDFLVHSLDFCSYGVRKEGE